MTTKPSNRPLSPHLQVYKPQITSVLSVFHRGTGIVLSLAAPLLVCWLAALAGGEESYATAQAIASSWFGWLVFAGLLFSIFYHLCNGIRHLFWDVGYGYEIDDLNKSGYAVVIASVVLTVITLLF